MLDRFQECHKLQNSITALDANVTVGFQDVQSKLKTLTTNKTNKSKKDRSEKPSCCELGKYY